MYNNILKVTVVSVVRLRNLTVCKLDHQRTSYRRINF